MDLDIFSILSIIGWVIGGAFTLGFSIKKTYNPNGIRWRKAFKGHIEIKKLLQEFVYHTSFITRASLIFAENGGGVPHPGSEIKTSILTEGFEQDELPYLDKWQKVPVDDTYAQFLAEVSTKGYYIIKDVSQLPDCAVKYAAESDGVTAFELHFIAANKKQWFYLVLSTRESLPQDGRYKDSVRVIKQQLATLVKK